MKRNHSLLEYTRDNDRQVSELGPSGPSCLRIILNQIEIQTTNNVIVTYLQRK